MFLSTLGIGAWSVHAWAKASTSGMYEATCEQAIPPRSRKQADGSAQDFLNSLPKMESHYCRRDTQKQYLEPVFRTFSDLYREYQSFCGEENRQTASIATLRKQFVEMNLGLFKPKKDQCDVCCQYEEGNIEQADYERHLKLKDMARKEKCKDKEVFQNDEKTVVLTVDLESVLLAPNLKASALYYKTKLACHNYTVYDLHSHHATCYLWHEGEGGLDADTFATCLLDYLDNDARCNLASTIIIYSDGCTYQNRNVTLANSLLHFSNLSGKVLLQKVLEKGHTQMECDSVHAACERALRDRKIYVPVNYVDYIKGAKKQQPYNVKYLSYDFFKSYSNLCYYQTIRPGHKVGDPVVTDIRQILYKNGSIKYKLDYKVSVMPTSI